MAPVAPGRIRLLLVAANPIGTSRLRLDTEIREIEQVILKSRNRDDIDIRKFQGLRAADLKHELLSYKPTHVHFCGHGNFEGIALVDENDLTQLVKFGSLARLLSLFKGQIDCVFLNACYSGSRPGFIHQYIPKVICMNGPIPDDTALGFAIDFYEGIGEGWSIEFSFKWALAAMELCGPESGNIPLLLTSEGPQKYNEGELC